MVNLYLKQQEKNAKKANGYYLLNNEKRLKGKKRFTESTVFKIRKVLFCSNKCKKGNVKKTLPF